VGKFSALHDDRNTMMTENNLKQFRLESKPFVALIGHV